MSANERCDDLFVEMNVDLLRSRSRVGQAKYGTTLERKDLSLPEWLNHLHEELLDAANYSIRALHEQHQKETLFNIACERILDMLKADDGQAWSEAEAFLKAHRPDLYNKIGMPDEQEG